MRSCVGAVEERRNVGAVVVGAVGRADVCCCRSCRRCRSCRTSCRRLFSSCFGAVLELGGAFGKALAAVGAVEVVEAAVGADVKAVGSVGGVLARAGAAV